MRPYLFKCATHGERDVLRDIAQCSDPAPCPDCGVPMKRVYRVQKPIMRPLYYNVTPDHPMYDNLDYEQELGMLHDDATPVSREEDRDLDAEESAWQFPDWQPDGDTMQTLHDLARVAVAP